MFVFKRSMLVFICSSMLLLFCFSTFTFSEDNSWTLIPVGSGTSASEKVKKVGETAGKVWENYNEEAKDNNVGTAFASGIFSWDTIFNFLKHIAKVLSEIGLVIGAGMIIYAGYKYATGVFTGDASKSGKDAIKGAIYGLLIVIFSYSIMKILLSMFW